MSQPKSSSKPRQDGSEGFSLLEVLVSIIILAIGLLGVALLISGTVASGNQAKFMNMANVLASEKLDSLNKWPSSDSSCDPNICAGGSLTGPAVCAATDTYCDQITVNEVSGVDYETQNQVITNADGTTSDQTTTIVHTSAGCVDTPANCGVAAPPTGGPTFSRRWLITQDPSVSTNGSASTITGVRRITVLVTLNNQPVTSPVSFQMSTVRP